MISDERLDLLMPSLFSGLKNTSSFSSFWTQSKRIVSNRNILSFIFIFIAKSPNRIQWHKFTTKKSVKIVLSLFNLYGIYIFMENRHLICKKC